MTATRDELARLDRDDPIAPLREAFDLPPGLIYLDGNSLGPLPKSARACVQRVLEHEWGARLIESWNEAGWFELPRRLGAKIAPLIGARADEVIVTDSTSINLFKVLASALALRPDRRVILSEQENFPTDLYMAEGLSRLLGRGHELSLTDVEGLEAAIDERTAVVMLTHVNYRTGRMHDLAGITARAHAMGALVIWDLAHSTGAVPVDLDGAGADFAIGCGYKYLNGGPGAPAFVYVAARHQAHCEQPLSGWWGHANPFAFASAYRPADGIERFLCGSQPIVSLALLECGLDIAAAAPMAAVRAKSLALTDRLIAAVAERCGADALALVTPRDHRWRGSQVSFFHPQGFAVMQALIARGIVGDYREPGILRFGIAPLYLRHADIEDAAAGLAEVLASRAWTRPEFRTRRAVT